MTNQHNDNQRTHKRNALGKGFNSLMGLDENDAAMENIIEGASVSEDSASNSLRTNATVVLKIPVEDIEPNPHQPRKVFNDDALVSLSNSIMVDGVIQPVIVSKNVDSGKYTLVAGERRWRASKLAGIDTIPAILKEGSSETILRMALIENIQRADLTVVEEAEAYLSLIEDFGLTQEQCAQKVGKDRATIANALRLLSLPKEVQDDLMDGRLTAGHGKALLGLEDKKAILRARDIIVKKQLNVRKTEQFCKTFKINDEVSATSSGDITNDTPADLEYLAEALRSHLKTKIKFSGNGAKGKIEISYFSPSELERIVGMLGVAL